MAVPSRHTSLSLSRRQLLGAGVASGLAGLAPGAFAQEWPARPVRMVVPFSAGGAADTSARAVGQRLSEALGQPLTIENRTGGNAVVAATAVLGAPRDGYTFIWDAANQITNPVLLKDLSFDYRTAFIPISMAVRAPQALVVRHDFPAKTFDEFIASAKARPGTISIGTPPSGAMGHLAVALLQQRAGIQLLHTPYRGGADAARDVMGGQIDAALITTSTARGTLASGKTRMLAVTSAARSQAYPDIPTIAERGLPGYDMDDWFGVFAPAGTPDVAIRRMQDAVAKAAQNPALAASVTPMGMVLVANSQAEFTQWLGTQRDLLQKLIKDANITIS
ncbi:MAG: tripartite tricarboxylate transporter substrate binding protein [Burkholderiales bacterium]|jgi:tripartite-type tricarboxylate transporter receptor subunit TctC|nr:tripartite tricarboxylate transporter substrate binding protein [Burkholderiales bacterium]